MIKTIAAEPRGFAPAACGTEVALSGLDSF